MASSRLVWAVVLGSFLVVAAVAVPVSGMLWGHVPLAPASKDPRPGGPTGPLGSPSNNSSTRYAVTFTESGLPSGTNWTVHLSGAPPSSPPGGPVPDVSPAWRHGVTNSSNTTSIGFFLTNGTYGFAVFGALSGSTVYLPSPAFGSVAVNGSAASVAVTFAPIVLHTVTFSESGLPTGTAWSVGLYPADPISASSNDPSAGPAWGHGSWGSSNGTDVNFTVPDGNYTFSVPNASSSAGQYVPTPSSGTVSVDGANVTVAVTFALVPDFELTFVESGLPSGTWWSVSLSDGASTGPGGNWSGFGPSCGSSQFNGSNTSTVGFLVPDGNYTFYVGNASNGSSVYVPTPVNGSVTVNGSDVTVDVTFTAVTFYDVTFAESGLPAGTWWSVVVANGTFGPSWNASNASTVNFTLPNGSYPFHVSGAWNSTGLYLPDPRSGSVTVDGANVTVAVVFSLLVTYELTFVESGLPNGTSWYAAIGDGWAAWSFGQSNGTELSFALPNGTFGYSLGPVWSDGNVYAPSPSYGSVTVSGAAVTIDVSYSEV